MKIAHLAAVTLTGLLAAGAAQADSANAAFNVTVSFTPKCASTNATTPVIAFGTYNGMDAAKNNIALDAPIAVSCSRGLAVSAAFDTAAEGLFATSNLRYTLSAITKTPVGTGTAASASSVGSADTYTFSFTGTLPQQAGGNTSSTNETSSRNLVLSF